jgi:tetratricopeptide (TPR) repeat protein
MKNTVFFAALFISALLHAQQAKVVSAINTLGYYQKDKSDTQSIRQAKGFIEEAIKSESTQGKAKTWYVRGNVYNAIHESKDAALIAMAGGNPRLTAIESYTKAIEIDPKYEYADECLQKSVVGYNEMAIESYNDKQYENAAKYFEKQAELIALRGKKDFTALQYAATSYYYYANYTKSIQLYNEVIGTDTTGLLHLQLFKAHCGVGDTATALGVLQKGRKLFPNYQPLLTENLNILFRQNKNAEAEELLRLAISNDPNNHTLWLAAGSTYENLGRKEDAVIAYKKAIEINKEAWQAYYNLGAIYNNIGKDLQDKANNIKDQKKYDEAIKIADDQLKLALTYLEQAKDLTPVGSTDRMDIMRALKQLYMRLSLNDKYDAIKKEMEQ